MTRSINGIGFRSNPGDEEGYKFDAYSHAVTTIDELHRLNHDGMVHHSSGKIDGWLDAEVDEFLIVVPALTFPHIQRFNLTVGKGDVDVVVYEGTTTSADGTLIGSETTNRNSSIVSATTLHSTPTVTGDGTAVHTAWLPPTATGVGQSAAGLVGNTNGEEWVLAPSTKYLIRMTNNSGATISYRYEFLWYEIAYKR